MIVSSVSTERGADGLPSGIDPIDREWGGFYRGGTYLAYGRAASGRGLLTLRFAAAGLAAGERCLFVASERIRDLSVEASSIGLDLRRAQQLGALHLTRVPPLVNLKQDGDEAVARALTDLVALIRRERPERVVVNDFLPFVMFRDFERFKRAFVESLEALDPVSSTLLIALPEPANDQSRRVVEFVAGAMTGSIHVEPFDYDPASSERRLTLTPHVGHLGGDVVCRWDLSQLVQLPSETRHAPILAPQEPAKEARAAGSGPARQRGEEEVAPPGPEPPPREGRKTRHEPEPESEPEPTPVPVPKAEPAAPPTPEPDPAAPPTPQPAQGGQQAGMDRATFQARLQDAFASRDAGGRPFLLLAMRLDPDNGPGPFDFEFVTDLVRESLKDTDAVLVDSDLEHLVVHLVDSAPEEAQDFFARLRTRLETEAPQRADDLLHAVSAIVVPDGRPFQTAAEFLSYALDQD